MRELAENVFLITGGGRGLGRRIAQALGTQGAGVVVNDINPDSAAETARLVRSAGGRAGVFVADISKKFPVQAMFNAIEDDWGRLDMLINNARVVPHKPLLEMDEWEWRRTLDVNLTGAFILTQVAGRILRAAGGGTIVHLLQQPSAGAGLTAYRTALSGLEGLGKFAAAEMMAAGIRYELLPYQEAQYEGPLEKVMALVRS